MKEIITAIIEILKAIFGKKPSQNETSTDLSDEPTVVQDQESQEITETQLEELHIEKIWLEPLKEVFKEFDISTPARQAAFIGQCQHESNNFKSLEENLNYSKSALCRVWPSRFTPEVAEEYARKPEKIANKVYSNRMGNGTEESGEGWKYRGRGVIQLTGKNNYRNCGEAIGVDLLSNPERLLEPKYAVLSAGWYWNKKNLNSYADIQDWRSLTKAINGGYNGLDDRIKHITEALEVLEA